MGALWCACALALLAAASGTSGVPQLRGVDPQLIPQYQASGSEFACLDGLLTIPRGHINDDYCDCFDGSDEPGTSACPNGSFYCRNRGHQPLRLNASMVDDQLCDCCDGSDERPGLCRNTCLEAGAAARAELKQSAATAARGEQLREAYASAWALRHSQWASEKKQLEAVVAQKSKLVSYWQGKKAAIEAEEQLEREQEAAARAAREALDAAAAAVSAPDEGAAAPAPALGPEEAGASHGAAEQLGGGGESARAAEGTQSGPDAGVPAELQESAPAVSEEAHPAASPQQEAEPAAAPLPAPPQAAGDGADARPAEAEGLAGGEGEGELDEESAEERGKRVAAQWTHDPEAVGEVAEEQEAEAAAEAAVAQPSAAAGEAEEVPQAETGLWGSLRGALAQAVGFIKGAKTQARQRQQVRDAFAKHQAALTALSSSLVALDRKLGLDFGPSGVFAELLDRCFSADVDKYTYEVCMYGEARQKEGGASTSLGSWRGFEDGHSTLLFDGGQQCWNGPQRSMRARQLSLHTACKFRVALHCGVEEALANVSEPNRCEYVARLVTPAACTPELVGLAQREYEEAERELAAVHDEL